MNCFLAFSFLFSFQIYKLYLFLLFNSIQLFASSDLLNNVYERIANSECLQKNLFLKWKVTQLTYYLLVSTKGVWICYFVIKISRERAHVCVFKASCQQVKQYNRVSVSIHIGLRACQSDVGLWPPLIVALVQIIISWALSPPTCTHWLGAGVHATVHHLLPGLFSSCPVHAYRNDGHLFPTFNSPAGRLQFLILHW